MDDLSCLGGRAINQTKTWRGSRYYEKITKFQLRENSECKNIYSNVNCIKGGTGDGFNLLEAD